MPATSNDAVFVGVDTHPTRTTLLLSINSGLGDREFPADPVGYRSLLDWISSIGSVTGVVPATILGTLGKWTDRRDITVSRRRR